MRLPPSESPPSNGKANRRDVTLRSQITCAIPARINAAMINPAQACASRLVRRRSDADAGIILVLEEKVFGANAFHGLEPGPPIDFIGAGVVDSSQVISGNERIHVDSQRLQSAQSGISPNGWTVPIVPLRLGTCRAKLASTRSGRAAVFRSGAATPPAGRLRLHR